MVSTVIPLLADLALAACVLLSVFVAGLAGLKLLRPATSLQGLEAMAFGAAGGVLIHALVGLAVVLSPARQVVAWALLILLWMGSLGALIRNADSRLGLSFRREPHVRRTLAILALFIAGCVGVTHLQVRFPPVLPDGPYVFKQHTLPVKIQVMTGNLSVDNYLPFVVEEFLLRDIPFRQERPIIPGQEVSNRPILLALAAIPFRAALDPPRRQDGPLGRFTYVGTQWPDTSPFMEGSGYRQFLVVGIVLNALLLLGAALVLTAHGPARLLVPVLLLLATSPYFISQTIFTWPKALAGFFLVVAVHALARGKSPLWVGGLGALGYWAHPYAVVFLLGFGGYYVVMALRARDRASLRALWQFGGIVALALAPWFLWSRVVLGIPSNLVEQNIASRGDSSMATQFWIRILILKRALGWSAVPFRAETLFWQSLRCLPGVLGLFVLPAYAGCAVCWRSHRLAVLFGVLIPLVLLAAPFSFTAALTLHGLQPVIVWLLVFACVILARAGRALPAVLFVAQIVLQLALLAAHGHALGVTFAGPVPFYRLLDHRPEVQDAPRPVNFAVDLEVGGERAAVIWSTPPAALIYRQIPLPERAPRFRTKVALHPLVWQDTGGDGAEFVLEVRRAGERVGQRVWSEYLDPAHRPDHRRWLAVEVDLSRFAGQTIDLTLKNGPGPAGNDYADWCLWGDPELTAQ